MELPRKRSLESGTWQVLYGDRHASLKLLKGYFATGLGFSTSVLGRVMIGIRGLVVQAVKRALDPPSTMLRDCTPVLVVRLFLHSLNIASCRFKPGLLVLDSRQVMHRLFLHCCDRWPVVREAADLALEDRRSL